MVLSFLLLLKRASCGAAYSNISANSRKPVVQILGLQQVAFSHSRRHASTPSSSLVSSSSPPEKERVVILGSGWAGYVLSRNLSRSKFAPMIISPRSYFVFTPLLNDAALGVLEFQHVVESARDKKGRIGYMQGFAREVDFKRKVVRCESSVVEPGVTQAKTADDNKEMEGQKLEVSRPWLEGEPFEVPYDKLVIAVGCQTQTFGTPGVKDNALFLKDVGDGVRVKRRVLECFELASMPTTSPELRKSLLHFAIVGGGPTGTEFAADLSDLIHEDLYSFYPDLKGQAQITVFDVAPTVLSAFDESLGKYAIETMKREGIEIKTSHHIEELRWGQPGQPKPEHMDPKGCLTLRTKEEGDIGVGLCLWATGNAMNPFIKDALKRVQSPPPSALLIKNNDSEVSSNIDLENATWTFKKHPRNGALLVDDQLRPQLLLDQSSSASETKPVTTATFPDVFALGDNAIIESGSPPATAQAANQEALWLANQLNKSTLHNNSSTSQQKQQKQQEQPHFTYHDLGILTYIGDAKGLMQLPHDLVTAAAAKEKEHGKKAGSLLPRGIKGRLAWLVWKGAYLNMTLSRRNRALIALYWVVNWFVGRNISRF